jgi:hypothetical protein
MAVLKWLPLALAFAALSGCSSADLVAHPSRDRAEGATRRSARVHHRPREEIITGSIGKRTAETTPKPFSKEWLAKQEELNRAFEAVLVKKMTICRSC